MDTERPTICSRRRTTTLLSLLLYTLAITQQSQSSDALHFYLDAGSKRCFSDSAAPNTKVLIEYTVSTGRGIMPIDLTVSLSEGKKQVLAQNNVEHGKIGFVLPFPDHDESDRHIYHAEAHRKKRQEQRNRRINPPNSRHLLAVNNDKHNSEEELHGGTYEDVDDPDDFDWDKYQGIHDKDVQHDQNGNERKLSTEEDEEEVFAASKFELCISNKEYKNEDVRRRVRLSIRKGDSAIDYSRLAKNAHMSQLETSLQRISDELHGLMSELDHTQKMEQILYRLNQGTNNQVAILGVLSLIVMSIVCAYQATYTRQYFKRKKII